MDWSSNINPVYFKSILDSFSEGIYITSPAGITLGVNKAYEKITGIPAIRLIGRHMDDIVSEGLLSGTITRQIINTGKEMTIDQNIFNGRRCVITGRPIRDMKGKIVLVVTVVRDIELIDSLQREMEKTRELACHYKTELEAKGERIHCVAKSPAFIKVLTTASKVAKIGSTVLIEGESGTGKGIIANEIHRNGPRGKQPFIKINCGSIPEHLLESELFGYEKGAFTGALPDGHTGLFETASAGTILLDEISDLPLALQVKLLRVLQEKIITRIGSSKEIKVDTRIIAATNENLEQMVLEKKFRKDLYYRLNVVHIKIPPLRERTEEIPALIDFFVARFNKKYALHKRLHPDLIKDIIEYQWPGNVRELENAIERMMVTSESDILCPKDIFQEHKLELSAKQGFTLSGILPLQEACNRVERYLIEEARKKYKTTYQVAAVLKISQPSASRKMRRYVCES
jgi:PAS domain S-box-containing protein